MTMDYGGDKPKDTSTPPITRAGSTTKASPSQIRTNDMYDISDFGKGFRNAMRDQGYDMSPFNGFLQRTVQRWAPSAFAQYLGSMASGARNPNVNDRGADIKDFLGQYISAGFGGSGIQPWGFDQAQSGLGALNSIIRGVQGRLGSAYSPDEINAMSDDERFAAVSKMGGVSPVMDSIAWMLGSNPELAQRVMLGAYLPSLGTGLGRSLDQMMDVRRQNWDDYQEAALTAPGKPSRSFLDALTGSLQIPFNR